MHPYEAPASVKDRVVGRMGRLLAHDVIAANRTALVVVDMQNYFCAEGFPAEVPLAREIVPNINRLASAIRSAGGAVVWAATGVFAIPAVPYLEAIGLEKEEFVQALGLSFTVSTVALALNVAVEGGLKISTATTSLAALFLACAGMWIGQAVRLRMSAIVFRRWFFTGLALLGYLVARSPV
jgi:uncharacterized membrane protein YfcA